MKRMGTRTRFAWYPRRVYTLARYENGNSYQKSTGRWVWLRRVAEVKNVFHGRWVVFEYNQLSR